MSPDLPSQSPAPLKNRRGWLIAFGVIEILTACLCLLLVPLMVVGLVVLSHPLDSNLVHEEVLLPGGSRG